MKVMTPGYLYELPNFEKPTEPGQQIQFIQKEIVEDDTEGELFKTVSDGTTNEAILTVLIDRLQFLQSKFPCRENAIVITKLEESLMWLEKRTADRVKRNVDGKKLV